MKKVFLLVALVLMAAQSFAVTTEADVEKTVVAIERYVYGHESHGDLTFRLRQLEEDLLGRVTGQNNSDKAASLNKLVFRGTSQTPSLDMRLSFLEWRLFGKTGKGNLATRISRLDQFISGRTSREPLGFRVDQLVHMSIEDGLIEIRETVIPRDTEIVLRLAETISSQDASRNDMVPMVISDDLFLDENLLVLGEGAMVNAKVESVRRGGRFGRTGFINLGFDSVETMDSTPLPVRVANTGQSRFDRRTVGKAVGASTVGYVLLGPIGVAGAAFVRGEDIDVPEGTEVTVRVREDLKVRGVFIPQG